VEEAAHIMEAAHTITHTMDQALAHTMEAVHTITHIMDQEAAHTMDQEAHTTNLLHTTALAHTMALANTTALDHITEVEVAHIIHHTMEVDLDLTMDLAADHTMDLAADLITDQALLLVAMAVLSHINHNTHNLMVQLLNTKLMQLKVKFIQDQIKVDKMQVLFSKNRVEQAMELVVHQPADLSLWTTFFMLLSKERAWEPMTCKVAWLPVVEITTLLLNGLINVALKLNRVLAISNNMVSNIIRKCKKLMTFSITVLTCLWAVQTSLTLLMALTSLLSA
jgi:hypothetical protein